MARRTHLLGDNLFLFPDLKSEGAESVVQHVPRESRTDTVKSSISSAKAQVVALRVRFFHSEAKLPAVAHPGEDLGYDVFSLETVRLAARQTSKLRTGIAVEARDPSTGAPLGLLVRDRSSMAARGLATTGGVIDAGYRGEILIVMTNLGDAEVELKAGEKIAQMVPVPVLTGPVEEVESLEDSLRAAKGFGSSGK